MEKNLTASSSGLQGNKTLTEIDNELRAIELEKATINVKYEGILGRIHQIESKRGALSPGNVKISFNHKLVKKVTKIEKVKKTEMIEKTYLKFFELRSIGHCLFNSPFTHKEVVEFELDEESQKLSEAGEIFLSKFEKILDDETMMRNIAKCCEFSGSLIRCIDQGETYIRKYVTIDGLKKELLKKFGKKVAANIFGVIIAAVTTAFIAIL